MDDLDAIGRCGAWTLTAGDPTHRIAISMKCRRWRCERCGPSMRRRLVYLTAQTTASRMLTLTANPELYPDPFSAARRMSWALGILISRARSRFDSAPIEYLAVWERTREGWPHLHVALTGPFIPQRWISQQWRGLTGAAIVDVRHLGTPGATGRYVAKYISKDPDPFLQGRAFRASRNFFSEPMRPQGKRACTFGPLTVYQGTVWDWLLDQTNQLWITDVDQHGLAVAAPWSSLSTSETSLWLAWERQRLAFPHHERAGPPGFEVVPKPWFIAREPGARGAAASAKVSLPPGRPGSPDRARR